MIAGLEKIVLISDMSFINFLATWELLAGSIFPARHMLLLLALTMFQVLE